MPLDATVMDLYSNQEEFLPGIRDRIIYDSNSEPTQPFEEETAGFMSHPASSPNIDDVKIEPQVILENMGMSDPECSHINAQKFTASALRNLIPKNNSIPDLAIPRGNVIREYNNPDLFPGLFPTLYPLGIGGLDIQNRETPISFRSQVEAYFDLFDHSFCYHRSFMFVALNIYQC